MNANSLTVGQRVRIGPNVTRTAWGAPCNWGGMEGVINGGGARVSGRRIYRVGLPGSDCTFGGNDLTEDMLEPIAAETPQADLFGAAGVQPSDKGQS